MNGETAIARLSKYESLSQALGVYIKELLNQYQLLSNAVVACSDTMEDDISRVYAKSLNGELKKLAFLLSESDTMKKSLDESIESIRNVINTL